MKRIDLIILIDALGWELLNHFDFLSCICPYRKKLKSLFGFSAACLPTIYTGKFPDEHKRWGMWYYSPKKSSFRTTKFLNILPELKIGRKNISRYFIQKFYKNYSHITEYFSIYNIPLKYLHYYDLASKKDIYEPNAFKGNDSIFDVIKRSGRLYYKASWRTDLRRAFLEAEQALLHDTDLVFIYSDELDGVLHRVGPDPHNRKVVDVLSLFDRRISRLYSKARELTNNVNLLVFSDHGMTQVTGEIDLMSKINALGMQEYHDYVVFYDSTMARFYYLKKGVQERIENALFAESKGMLLTEERLKQERVFFHDHKFGQGIFAAKSGLIINPSMIGVCAPEGMHGYLPDHPSADAALLSAQKLPKGIEHISDLYNLMRSVIS